MAETSAAFLILENAQEIGRKCQNLVIVFIITPDNNGCVLVRHSNEANNVGKEFLFKKIIFLLNAKITQGHCKTSKNIFLKSHR